MTMKRTILLAALAACAFGAQAQTLCVLDHENSVTWVYAASALTESMPFHDKGITIDGFRHEPKASCAWMTVYPKGSLDDVAANPDVVYVRTPEDGSGFQVLAAGQLAPYLTIQYDRDQDGVDITVADNFERELTFVLGGEGGYVSLHGNYKTTVVLDGVELRTHGGCNRPALWIDNGKRIDFLVNGQNAFADNASNEKKGALHVKGHAEWKGDGTVSIAGVRHAYSSNEYTQFKKTFTGTFNVTSAGSDGMHVQQYLQIDGGTFNIAGNVGDGIDVGYVYTDESETTPTQDEYNGQFLMNGGTITVSATADDTKGLKSDDSMTITAGRINATATGNGSRGIQTSKNLYLGTEGATDVEAAYIYLTASGSDYVDTETGDTNKCRGLKVKQNFYHYPSTVERNAASTVKAKKMVDVDGAYLGQGGKLKDITIE